MGLGTGDGCVICGSISGYCSPRMHAVTPVEFALRPEGNGVPKKYTGKWFHTNERIFQNGRLVLGRGDSIPWARAIELGLVEPDEPVAEIPEYEPPHEMPERSEDGERVPELVADPVLTAAITRRRKTPSGKLKAS